MKVHDRQPLRPLKGWRDATIKQYLVSRSGGASGSSYSSCGVLREWERFSRPTEAPVDKVGLGEDHECSKQAIDPIWHCAGKQA